MRWGVRSESLEWEMKRGRQKTYESKGPSIRPPPVTLERAGRLRVLVS